MDFEAVFRMLLETLEKHQVRYALIGGWALTAAGHVRATQDIDFLVHREDYPKLKTALMGFGYDAVHESADAANFVGKLKPLGQVDLLLAHRPYAVSMLRRAVRQPIFAGQFEAPVLLVEDLIGLKVQSMVNDPSRYHADLADIEALLRLNAKELDWDLIEEYFKILDKLDEFNTLKKLYG